MYNAYIMLLIVHIFTAFISLFVSTIVVLYPSKFRLISSYILFGITVISGIVVSLQYTTNIAQSCLSGFVYGVFTLTIHYIAHRKLLLKPFRFISQ